MQNHQQEAAKPQKGSSLQWAVKSRIAGLQAVTISAPGVLLEENTVQELEVRGSWIASEKRQLDYKL